MIDIFKKLWQNPLLTLKIVGGGLIGLILLTAAFQLVGNTMNSFRFGESFSIGSSPSSIRNEGSMYGGDYDMNDEALMQKGMPSPVVPSDGGFTSGNNAEDFEVTEYNSTIKTGDKNEACTTVSGLKTYEYVIFENANDHKTGCNFSFKVQNDHATEVLSIIEGLHPENLSANTYTIKRSIENTTSEVEILEQKLVSINETLASSLEAYDDITKLATASRDAGSLATIIDSKVRLIERLTEERLNVNERLARLERNKNQQLERLDYTYFYVSVYEDKYFNGQQIKDSWKNAIQLFVQDSNRIVQEISVGMIVFLLYVIQYVLYFFILFVIARRGWKYVKRTWRQ